MLDLTLIIPSHKSAVFLRDTVVDRLRVLNKMKIKYELIVVIDGEERDSVDSIKDLTIRLIQYKRNRGKGFAIKTGIINAKESKYIAYIDAGMDLESELIESLYSKITNKDLDFVLPSKIDPKSKVNYPDSRRLSSHAYRLFLKALFGYNVTDTQTGAKIYKAEAIYRVIKMSYINRFNFEIEFLYWLFKFGYIKFEEIPVNLNFDFKSTISKRDIFNILFSTINFWVLVKLLKKIPKQRFEEEVKQVEYL